MARAKPQRTPLTADERDGVVLAVKSVFRKLKNLYDKVVPIFNSYGFEPQSAGVIARDFSEKVEAEIIRHCNTFKKGDGHCDLSRLGCDWEVKVCKGSGMTINQSKVINGENYIVVNYTADSQIKRIWILWQAKDGFFSSIRKNSNARTLNREASADHVEMIFEPPKP